MLSDIPLTSSRRRPGPTARIRGPHVCGNDGFYCLPIFIAEPGGMKLDVGPGTSSRSDASHRDDEVLDSSRRGCEAMP